MEVLAAGNLVAEVLVGRSCVLCVHVLAEHEITDFHRLADQRGPEIFLLLPTHSQYHRRAPRGLVSIWVLRDQAHTPILVWSLSYLLSHLTGPT